jgi:hypothetical protein
VYLTTWMLAKRPTRIQVPGSPAFRLDQVLRKNQSRLEGL